jgi:hypothetical protein
VVFVATDAASAGAAARLALRLKDVATLQVVTDVRDVPVVRSDADTPPDLPLELIELRAPMPLDFPDLVDPERPCARPSYGPARRGRKGKPLRW